MDNTQVINDIKDVSVNEPKLLAQLIEDWLTPADLGTDVEDIASEEQTTDVDATETDDALVGEET